MNVLSIAGFTNLGYHLHARHFDDADRDLDGQVVVVTGGTGGLGLAAAKGMSRMGAHIVIVARSEEKLERAGKEMSGDHSLYMADLSLMAEVSRVADEIAQRGDRLDVLVNNVGVLFPERRETSEGLEATLATNLAGHFLLTHRLIPKLIEDSPGRIINVTSGGMYAEKIRPRDLQYEHGEYKGATAYARTKRGQVILTEMWAERLASTGVTVHAMHPGWARTAGVKQSLPTFNRLIQPLLRTPSQGADTTVWLASAQPSSIGSGDLWFDRRRVPTHLVDRTRESADDRDDLWARLVDITGSDFPNGIS